MNSRIIPLVVVAIVMFMVGVVLTERLSPKLKQETVHHYIGNQPPYEYTLECPSCRVVFIFYTNDIRVTNYQR